jgi:addiction module HigA family antidote
MKVMASKFGDDLVEAFTEAAAYMRGVRMRTPTHPGCFVKEDILPPLGLSVTAAAKALGVARQTLSAFLNERSRLSPDTAIRIQKAFGVSAGLLMRMQTSFNIAKAERLLQSVADLNAGRVVEL